MFEDLKAMEENKSLFSLSIDPVTKSHLLDTAKWARFLAISGLVFLVLGLVVTIMGVTFMTDTMDFTFSTSGTASDEISNNTRVALAITTIILSAVVFFPLLFLLQFANRMKKALAANQQEDLNMAFLHLKKHFRYIGIIVLIFLVLYALIIVLGVLGSAAS